jgi:hypothetical protein
LNACDGCGTLSATPGVICSCGGIGESEWTCSGEDVLCLDNDDTPGGNFLGSYSADDLVETTGWMDSTSDIDWYVLDAVDTPIIGLLDVTATIYSTDIINVDYEVCAFYRYNDTADILSYDCGFSDRCVYYDTSDSALINVDPIGVTGETCLGAADFDADNDLYGCCERGLSEDGVEGWRVGVYNIDLPGPIAVDEGSAYVLVSTTDNFTADACDNYMLDIEL